MFQAGSQWGVLTTLTSLLCHLTFIFLQKIWPHGLSSFCSLVLTRPLSSLLHRQTADSPPKGSPSGRQNLHIHDPTAAVIAEPLKTPKLLVFVLFWNLVLGRWLAFLTHTQALFLAPQAERKEQWAPGEGGLNFQDNVKPFSKTREESM